MDRERRLAQLAERLHAARGAKHWRALASIDTELAQSLPAMKEQGAWSTREQLALSAVRRAHGLAYEDCLREGARLGRQLEEMQTHKEGWMAYAMNHDSAGGN